MKRAYWLVCLEKHMADPDDAEAKGRGEWRLTRLSEEPIEKKATARTSDMLYWMRCRIFDFLKDRWWTTLQQARRSGSIHPK